MLSAVAVALAILIGLLVSETYVLNSIGNVTMYGADVCAFGVHSFFSVTFSPRSLAAILVEKRMVCYKPAKCRSGHVAREFNKRGEICKTQVPHTTPQPTTVVATMNMESLLASKYMYIFNSLITTYLRYQPRHPHSLSLLSPVNLLALLLDLLAVSPPSKSKLLGSVPSATVLSEFKSSKFNVRNEIGGERGG
jgi:hypothetical protein